MEEISGIGTSLKMFQVRNSSVGKIASQAFSVVSIDSLVFENSKIDRIEKGSVAEKVSDLCITVTSLCANLLSFLCLRVLDVRSLLDALKCTHMNTNL